MVKLGSDIVFHRHGNVRFFLYYGRLVAFPNWGNWMTGLCLSVVDVQLMHVKGNFNNFACVAASLFFER